MEEYLGSSREGLDVGRVLGQKRDDRFGETILPANIGYWSNHRKIDLVDHEQTFGLHVEADHSGVLDKDLGMGSGENGPDRSGYGPELRSGLQGWLPATC